MNIAHNQTIQRLIGDTIIERALLSVLSWGQLRLLKGHKPRSVTKLIRQVRRERVCLQSPNELFMAYSLARSCRGIPGDYAEVGVFQGASAKVISCAATHKTLYLFDTFEGLPVGDAVHRKGMFSCSLESVRDYVGTWNTVYHKGRFPASASPLVGETCFAFVHLDVDLYESTIDSLRWLYHRMSPGGVILTHDYSLLAGVRQAFDEFLVNKPEHVIELPTTQAMLVKQ